NLLHRDVKPHNVLVTRDAIKLMDFGIARELTDSQEHLTRTGQVVGTLAYMPPEMMHPDPSNPVGVAADVYMAGVLLRELLTFHPNGHRGAGSVCPPAWRALIRDPRTADPADRPTLIEFRDRLLDRLSTPPAAIPVAQTVPARPATPPPAPAPRKVELPRE